MCEPKLIIGDCIQVMRDLPGESVDLIVADPPYNLGKDYGNGSDSCQRQEYLGFTHEWLSEATRLLKSHGSIYVFMGFRFISRLYIMLEEEFDLHFHGWIAWHYTQGMGRTKGFSPRHDDILFFSKSKVFTFNLDNIRIPQKYYRSRNNMRGANPGDVWEFSHVHYCQESRTAHPTQKPEGIVERMVLASSNENDLVLDPFVGSGTTLRVCQQLGRQSMGIELSSEYGELIKKRLSASFHGFDSVDPRMKRIPSDLNDPAIRTEYRKNHKLWFLSNHPQEQQEFDKAFRGKYAARERQVTLFSEVSEQSGEPERD